MENAKNAKNAKKFKCENCDFVCYKQSEWNRHIMTLKHEKIVKGNNMEILEITNKEFQCIHCNHTYKTNSGLWKHNKKCLSKNDNETIIEDNNLTQSSSEVVHLTNLVVKLMNSNDEIQKKQNEFQQKTLDLQKENQYLQKQMLEVCKTGGTNHSYNNNKTFNMQIFLNEKCKDAMNIMDFVNSMTLELSDLEDVGELGYVDGISNIIIKKLNEMDIYKRPVHCSDTKRESLFVKDNDIWEKEESGRDTLRRAIKYISKKNSDLLPAWSEENPESQNIYSKRNDHYIKMVLQAMGGRGDIEINENKIMKKISKAVMINKSEI